MLYEDFLLCKSNGLFAIVSPNIFNNSFLNSSNFFPAQHSFLNVCKMFLGKRRQTYSDPIQAAKMKLLTETVLDEF